MKCDWARISVNFIVSRELFLHPTRKAVRVERKTDYAHGVINSFARAACDPIEVDLN